MTTMFHARPSMKASMTLHRATSGEKNLIERTKAPIFFGDGFSNRDHVRASIQFRRERQLQHFFRTIHFDFFIALVLLDQSNETS